MKAYGIHMCSHDCFQDNNDEEVDARAQDKEFDGDVPSNIEGACKDDSKVTATTGSSDRRKEGGDSEGMLTNTPHL